MESKSLIQTLNYSKTLIQNGEMKFLYYEQKFLPPDKVGEQHRKIIADLKRQLQEEPAKSDNPEKLRKDILQELEEQKKFGAFRYSNKMFSFAEVNLIFQSRYAYRAEIISRYEKYPSFNAVRFYGGGGQFYWFSDSIKKLMGIFPIQFDNSILSGSLEESELKKPGDAFTLMLLIATNNLPPPFHTIPVDGTRTEAQLTEDSFDIPIYTITTISVDKETKRRYYVRIKAGLPEIFKREVYYKAPKSHPQMLDAEGYRLSSINLFSNFERVEGLNISIPRVHEERLLSALTDDEFMIRRIIMKISEMDFNLELPTNFFDWDLSELTSENAIHTKNLSDVEEQLREIEKEIHKKELSEIEKEKVQANLEEEN